jgi:hypothetical protein
MNVGVLRKPEPFTYQKENSKIFEVLDEQSDESQ